MLEKQNSHWTTGGRMYNCVNKSSSLFNTHLATLTPLATFISEYVILDQWADCELLMVIWIFQGENGRSTCLSGAPMRDTGILTGMIALNSQQKFLYENLFKQFFVGGGWSCSHTWACFSQTDISLRGSNSWLSRYPQRRSARPHHLYIEQQLFASDIAIPYPVF